MSAGRLESAVAACLQRHVATGDRLLVGLSGGVDSVCLLHVLSKQVPAGCLAALHVHHGLSPNAAAWAQFSADFCRALAIPFSCHQVSVERGSDDGLEAAARRARHTVFAQAEADWVLLGHHRDDQAETMVFNLLRGSGLTGAAGMQARSGRLLRPLLDIGREDVVAYAAQHGLTWCEDESNADTYYSRNFLRQQVFPLLHGRWPATSRNLAQAAGRFAEAASLLDELARIDLGALENFPVPVSLLQSVSEPRGRNLLRYLLALNAVRIPGESRLREALRQLIDAAPDRHPAVTFGAHQLVRRKGQIYLDAASS